MYLLMLLATFMAALHGYTLSARPDYDRHVAVSKASAILYRFAFASKSAHDFIVNFDNGRVQQEGVYDIYTGDMLYTNYKDESMNGNEDTHLILNQDGNEYPIYLRAQDRFKQNNPGNPKNMLAAGRFMYDSSEMANMVLCTVGNLHASDNTCVNETDEEGNVSSSCCKNRGVVRYFVSYRKMDARWINRLTGEVSLDFMKAITKHEYRDNVGVITWNGTNWVFQGKIFFYPVYAQDEADWIEAHFQEGGDRMQYPSDLKHRTTWVLPNKIFKENTFKSNVDGTIKDICKDHGCLFRIRQI